MGTVLSAEAAYFFPVEINDPTSGSLRNATILIRMVEVLVQEAANPRLIAGRMASVKTPISLKLKNKEEF